jgi:hypothetical protein
VLLVLRVSLDLLVLQVHLDQRVLQEQVAEELFKMHTMLMQMEATLSFL